MAKTTVLNAVLRASVSALAVAFWSSMAMAEGDLATAPDVTIDPIETSGEVIGSEGGGDVAIDPGVAVGDDSGTDVSIDPIEVTGVVIDGETPVDPELGDPNGGSDGATDPAAGGDTPVEPVNLDDPSVIVQNMAPGMAEQGTEAPAARSHSAFETQAERDAALRSVPDACDTAGPGLAWLCGKKTH